MPSPYWANKGFIWLVFALWSMACQEKKPKEQLPVLGPMELVTNDEGGTDTLFFPFPNFKLEDQYGITITPDSLQNQILVVDFFFSSCPTICKDLLRNMRRVNEKFRTETRLRLLSHTVDPDYDTQAVLFAYAQQAGAQGRNWLFLRGEEEVIYHLAQKAYLSHVQADTTAPGGYLHSGHIILMDANKRIRGVYDGTNDSQLALLLKDIQVLLEE